MLPVFYPIFDSAQWFDRLLPLGIKLAQLRIKDKSKQDIRAEIARAMMVSRRYDCQLIVNDYWDIAIDLGCLEDHQLFRSDRPGNLARHARSVGGDAAFDHAGFALNQRSALDVALDLAVNVEVDRRADVAGDRHV